jgi:hypothetical protein
MRTNFATLALAPSKPQQRPLGRFGTRLRIGHGDQRAIQAQSKGFSQLECAIPLKIPQIQPILVTRLPLMAPQRLLEV